MPDRSALRGQEHLHRVLPQLVVSITPKTQEEIKIAVERVPEADYVEIRLEGDFIPERLPEFPVILKLSPENVKRASALSPAVVDVPVDMNPFEVRKLYPKSLLLGSLHVFEGERDNTQLFCKNICQLGFDAIKIACYCQTTLEGLQLLKLYKQLPQGVQRCGITIIPMGEKVSSLRCISAQLGGQFFYTCLDGKKTAPGQINYDEALHQYRVREAKKFYCLIGDPVAQSPSHTAHNKLFKELGIEANYLKLLIAKEELRESIELLDTFGCLGMSITAPHKQLLSASKGVSYNTRYKSLNGDSSFSLANTDLEAFDELVLEPFLRTSAGSLAALVIGAGATASTFAKKLIERGFTVTFVNRTDTNAETLASNLRAQSIPFNKLFEAKKYHLIVRAAAVDKVEERFDFFPHQLVLDMQLEKESTFVRKARRQGSKVIDGYMFWARQAARQYRYWFGVEDIDQLAERLYVACS